MKRITNQLKAAIEIMAFMVENGAEKITIRDMLPAIKRAILRERKQCASVAYRAPRGTSPMAIGCTIMNRGPEGRKNREWLKKKLRGAS